MIWKVNRSVSYVALYYINNTYLLTYLFTYAMEQSPSWEANQETLPLVKKFPAFMEPESSSPYPQVPAIRP